MRTKRRKNLVAFALVLAFAPGAFGITLPRWLFRGVETQAVERVVYEAVPPDGSEVSVSDLRDQAVEALCRRREIYDWVKIKFEPEGDSRIAFVLPLMKEGTREFALFCLSRPSFRAEFRAVAPENEEWIRALFEEKRAPEHLETVSAPDGDFWRDPRIAEDPDGNLPRPIPPGFAERPGFEICQQWCLAHEDRSFLRPFYLSADAWTPSRPPDARVGKTYDFDACIHVALDAADRASFAAFATDPETGHPRRLAVTGDDNVIAVFTPSPSDLAEGRFSFSPDPLAFPRDNAQDWYMLFAALFSAPLPCTLERIESPSDETAERGNGETGEEGE